MSISAYANTTMGTLRRNDDSYAILDIQDYVIVVVVDGNGGDGAIVNTGAIGTSVIEDYFRRTISTKTSFQEIEKSVQNLLFLLSRIYLTVNALGESYANINASLAIAVIEKTSLMALLCSIGSSEIQIIQNARYRRLTQLYTEAYELVDKGAIPPEDLYTHPKRAILTSALGTFDNFQYDMRRLKLMKDDILLLLTDGVYRVTSPAGVVDTMADAIQEAVEKKIQNNIKYCVDKVLEKANRYQCDDNATMALIYIPDDNGAKEMMKAEQQFLKPISSLQKQAPVQATVNQEPPRNNFFATPKSKVQESRENLFRGKKESKMEEYNPYGI